MLAGISTGTKAVTVQKTITYAQSSTGQGIHPFTNNLSTDPPTINVGNCASPTLPPFKTQGQDCKNDFSEQLAIFCTTLAKPCTAWATVRGKHLIHRSANRLCGQVRLHLISPQPLPKKKSIKTLN